MKLITAIVFSFILLLPGVGVHLDLSYCCGVIDEIGLAHQMEMDMSSCCDDSHKLSCMTESEILQPPTQLDFISTDKTLVNPIFTVSFAFLPFQSNLQEVSRFSYSLLANPPPRKIEQSLFQVFLC